MSTGRCGYIDFNLKGEFGMRYYAEEALGMLETVGMVPALEACDKMLKACLLYTSSCIYHRGVEDIFGEDSQSYVLLSQRPGHVV